MHLFPFWTMVTQSWEHPLGHPGLGVHAGKLSQGGRCRDLPESCSEPLAEANESQVLRLPCMAEGTPKILTRVFCPAWRALARAQASEDTCEESEFPALPHASDLPSPAPRCHPTLGPRDRSPPSKEPWDLRSVSWLCHSLTFHAKGSPVNWAPGTRARHSWGPRPLTVSTGPGASQRHAAGSLSRT